MFIDTFFGRERWAFHSLASSCCLPTVESVCGFIDKIASQKSVENERVYLARGSQANISVSKQLGIAGAFARTHTCCGVQGKAAYSVSK